MTKEDTKVERLSAREHQVALLVARGFRNKEVARELGITDGTVKLHLHKIFRKLGVRNRRAIYFWLAAGLDNQRQAETGAANDRTRIHLTCAKMLARPIRQNLHESSSVIEKRD
jgi:DNA-binding CsgD family transcriptional regulator